jgi:hypothetical protein
VCGGNEVPVSFAVWQLLAKFLLFQLFVLVIVEAYTIL